MIVTVHNIMFMKERFDFKVKTENNIIFSEAYLDVSPKEQHERNTDLPWLLGT